MARWWRSTTAARRISPRCRRRSRTARPRSWCFSSSTRCSQGRRTCARCRSRSARRGCRPACEHAPANIRYVEHFVTAGDAVLRSACRMDLEGIVSKRLDAPYQSGRGESWMKSKCRAGHEVVIGGWTTTDGAFRSLIAGVNRDGRLVHVGRVGTGFGREKVDRLLPQLKALETDKSPFTGKDRAARAARRALGAARARRRDRVRGLHRRRTAAPGIVQGRCGEDKPAEEVEAETPAPARPPSSREPAPAATAKQAVTPRGSVPVMGVTISHADKPLWPDARRRPAGHQARSRPLLRSRRRLDAAAHQGPALLDDPHARRHRRRSRSSSSATPPRASPR